MSVAGVDIRQRSWRRLPGIDLLIAVILGIGGYLLGNYVIGGYIAGGLKYQVVTDQNDVGFVLGCLIGVAGFLIGLGFLNYPIQRMLGRPAHHFAAISPDQAGRGEEYEHDTAGVERYFRMCTDHKVVGIQYLVGVLFFFFVAGLNAMFIRTELLFPVEHFWTAQTYITLVGLHGTMMMMMMSALIVGPFGNYFVPILIGAKRMAFPRLESLSFWLVPAAEIILLGAIGAGGFPSGWTGYGNLSDQAKMGMDSYLLSFALIGLSMAIVGLNMLATVITMRAPGMTWGRLPIFVWAVFATSFLMLLAAPVLIVSMALVLLDRTVGTTFFQTSGGGTPYLYENLFWVFGHPEVYILALPGFGLVLEIIVVFARKPLWGYPLAVAGMLGVSLLSFFVWQHHLFVSGINANLRPFYMLTTEMISIPTGFIFLNAVGTLWRAKIRYTVPMLFALALFFNFFIGGVSGVYNSDAPSDVTTHGSFFVTGHFHYTIMGGLVFAFFAGIYYWFPKLTGYFLNETLGKIQFWMFFIAFNFTFFGFLVVGFLGQPRRVSAYDPTLQGLNDFITASAWVIGMSMVVFAANLVYSFVFARQVAGENPWHSLSLEWQLTSPVPLDNFDQIPFIQSGPYEYGVPDAPAVANLTPLGAALASGD
ncbi:MAG: cytochrome c oxidase subunit I [Candidatus Dormibacteraceae bacterium]